MTETNVKRNYKDTVFRMPLRDLIYVTKVLQGQIRDQDLYSSRQIKLPTPRFVVFYNGTEPQPQKQVLKLSDAFEKQLDDVELAVDTCIRQGILRDFLKKNRAEAIEMSIFEYDEEKHMQSEREIWENAGREAGIAEGRQSGLIEGIINMSLDFHLTKQEIIERLQGKLNISAQEAEESYQKYVQEHQ